MTYKKGIYFIVALACASLCSAEDFADATPRRELLTSLRGNVSAVQEPRMEGVIVSARHEGQSITFSVVSDARGRYIFLRANLTPGTYIVSIRAVGYELAGRVPSVSVKIPASKEAVLDLRLEPVVNLAAQLTNGEWLASIPGSEQEKRALFNCANCHTLSYIMTSKHTEDEWPAVLARMAGYAPGSTSGFPQQLVGGFRLPAGEGAGVAREAMQRTAKYLSSINLSKSDQWTYELKPRTRPRGRATKVMFTEYDLPRSNAMPHDVIIDEAGDAWYADFGDMYLGKLDPATGQVIEYRVPEIKPGFPKGMLDLEFDPHGDLWAGMMFQGGIFKFDRRRKAFELFPAPAELQNDGTALPMVTPYSSNVDGKVWTVDAVGNVLRLDLATGQFINLGRPKDASGRSLDGFIYGIPADSKNNLYLLNFSGSSIGELDPKTLKFEIYEKPLPATRPRRGQVDWQDKLWYAEYAGNSVTMFDSKTGQLKTWSDFAPWTLPYDVVHTRSGDIWTGSMMTDRVVRLNPQSGESIEYLLPKSTNIRRVFFDEKRNSLWIGSNHGASIIKVQPLD